MGMQIGRKDSESHWGLADVLRVEVLAHGHEQARLSGHERMENEANRTILKELIRKHPQARDWERRRFLRAWMEAKWTAVHGDNSGNELLENLQKTGRLVIWGGFFLGLLVHSLWSQLGNSVNVMAVFLTHVILPLIFLLFLCIHFVPGLKPSQSIGSQKIWHPVVMLFLGLCRRLAGSWRIGPGKPVQLAEVLKFVLQRRGRIVVTWISMLIQRGALAYLAGFWVWFVFQLLTRSAAFSWGTTLGSIVSAERVSRVTGWINLPWQWFYAGPTQEQIAATQSWYGQALPVVKSGWEAWAVFLMMAILVYAILPRFVVLVIEGLRLRWLISREIFDALRFERLLNGMLVQTGLDPDSPDPSETRSEPYAALHMPGKARKERDHDIGLIIGLESIIKDREAKLQELLLRKFQLNDCRWLRLGEAAEGHVQLRERVHAVLKDWLPVDHGDRILHLVDCEQNPKQSYQSRLSIIREIIGPQAGIVFVLIGGSQKSLQEREKLWLKSIRKWGDFNTDVTSLPIENIQSPEPSENRGTDQ
jgi:hypothetical protein